MHCLGEADLQRSEKLHRVDLFTEDDAKVQRGSRTLLFLPSLQPASALQIINVMV